MKMTNVSRAVLIVFLAAAFSANPAFCDNLGITDQGTTNEDELFGGDNIITEIPETDASAKEQDVIPVKNVDIGGSFFSTFTAQGSWWFLLHPEYEPAWPDEQSLLVSLGTSIFLDARPDEHFRVFAKANILYPFNQTETFSLLPSSENLKIKEMFADTDIANTVFFRVGKQTVKWGVGYFFSPADVINLIPIDPANPGSDREGPVAIKVQVPVETTNFYLYVLDYDIAKPDELAVAGKAEFVLGNLETTVGAFYKKDASPAGILELTLPFGSFGFFGEGIASYGSNKTFVRKNGLLLETYNDTSDVFVSATAGVSYLLSDGHFAATLQYYFNGEGYGEDGFVRDNFVQMLALAGTGALAPGDLSFTGMHYGACSVSISDIGNTDLGVSLFWIGNLTDRSGRINPSVSWTPADHMSFSLGVPFYYGDEYDELSPKGSGVVVSVSVSIGGGDF